MKQNIKEKVLKEVLEQKWISLDGKLPLENVIKDTIDLTLVEVGKVINDIPYSVILKLREGDYVEDGEVDGCKENVLMNVIEKELKGALGIK